MAIFQDRVILLSELLVLAQKINLTLNLQELQKVILCNNQIGSPRARFHSQENYMYIYVCMYMCICISYVPWMCDFKMGSIYNIAWQRYPCSLQKHPRKLWKLSPDWFLLRIMICSLVPTVLRTKWLAFVANHSIYK